MTERELPERVEELLAGYVLGNLSPLEAEELKRLLVEQPELAEEVNRLQEVLELMPYALLEVTPPQHLRKVILEAGDVEIQRQLKPKKLPIKWRNLTGSVAALLLIALSLNNYNLRQKLSVMQAQADRQKDVIAMLQNPSTHLVSLKGMDRAARAAGSIVMTPGEPQSVLILQNLPILPKGQFYQLWSVVNGEKIPSGQFNASLQGTVLVKLPTPSPTDVQALVVTVEVSPTPKSPSGPLVMTSNL
ncbi:MAG: anti-sigma factor [Chamaesiphon sp.]